jgi:hypothetical protein
MADLQINENMVRMKLKADIGDANPTEGDIKKAVDDVSLLLPMTDNEKEYIEKLLQSNYKVRMDLGEKVINEATYHPWIANNKAKINFYYWNRYCKYLELDQGWTSDVIDSLGAVSDDILDLCGNPNEEGNWKRKGLVLGDIQSGKTSNYLALCNKAADAGYKIIILLTGTIESLRKQTQERVDAGFVGLNSRNVLQKNPEKKYIGVGSIDSNRTALPFTDIISDFNSAKLQSLNFTIKGMPEPVILVLKKNKSVLENLATWLSTRNTSQIGAKIDLPLLLIDDEADNASVNTNKPDKSPTAINNAIVEVLKLFNRSSYVAVTATPFANIFIDPDLDKGSDEFNLFPSDFIYALSAPTNYIGASKIFTEDGKYTDALEAINDVVVNVSSSTYIFRSKAKSGHVVPYLPESLKKAIRYFLIVNTVMDLKGSTNSHRSMLINVSQFVNVQNQVYDLTLGYLKKLQTKIQSYSKLGMNKALQCEEISDLFDVWKEFNMQDKTGYTAEQILDSLYESTMPIQLRLVNQNAKEKGVERLDYDPYKESGLRVIAVGGNSLSRGLTLEGLSVSYFDRNSQMYDTLMQMGRWFGYRRGYDNLFKIWMEPAAMNWYQYISEATDELKNEIVEMRRIGLTPKEFGLKVQQNMVSLFVTARSKMRATTTVEQWISLAAEVVETPRLIANKEKCLDINLGITNNLISQIEEEGNHVFQEYNFTNNRVVYTGVDKDTIAKYIGAFVSHPRHIPFNARDLSEHIQNSVDYPKWTVAVIGGSGQELENTYFNGKILTRGIHYSSRIMQMDDNCLLIYGQRARVGVPGATKYGLNESQINDVKSDFQSKEENQGKMTIPDKPYLKMQREPVLLIYLIKIDKEVSKGKRVNNSDEEAINLVGDLPVVGLGLGFPGAYEGAASQSAKVKYVLNRISERDMLNFEEDSEDEDK